MYISRQDAIKAIEDLPNCYNGFSDTYDKACIIGTLEELPSAQQWIPCSERLPEENGRYLCTENAFNNAKVTTICSYAHNLHKVDEYDFPQEKNGWYDYDDEYGYYEDEQVYAWMPLPEPWKGEGV